MAEDKQPNDALRKTEEAERAEQAFVSNAQIFITEMESKIEDIIRRFQTMAERHGKRTLADMFEEIERGIRGLYNEMDYMRREFNRILMLIQAKNKESPNDTLNEVIGRAGAVGLKFGHYVKELHKSWVQACREYRYKAAEMTGDTDHRRQLSREYCQGRKKLHKFQLQKQREAPKDFHTRVYSSVLNEASDEKFLTFVRQVFPTNMGEVVVMKNSDDGNEKHVAVKVTMWNHRHRSHDNPFREMGFLGLLNIDGCPYISQLVCFFHTVDDIRCCLELCEADLLTYTSQTLNKHAETEAAISAKVKRTEGYLEAAKVDAVKAAKSAADGIIPKEAADKASASVTSLEASLAMELASRRKAGSAVESSMLEIKEYFRQACEGLRHMHNGLYIAHRDLKPENILVNPSRGQAMLADVGVALALQPMLRPGIPMSRETQRARFHFEQNNLVEQLMADVSRSEDIDFVLDQLRALRMEHKDILWAVEGDSFAEVVYVNDKIGTPEYMAPEVFLEHPHDPRAADIWSMGLTMVAIFFGISPMYKRPQVGDLNFELLCRRGFAQYIEQKFQTVKSIQLVDLISRMLIYNPAERLTIAQVLAHPYFSGAAGRGGAGGAAAVAGVAAAAAGGAAGGGAEEKKQ